ncbi:DUF523 domain-containing protein [Peptostreptococcus faecalis]|uniref:DUF523 domain-containing protein n=1 Tax=Peptostreptococcus faecalis TaxID=2045015 RepID=UPI000C7DB1C4|nr:DUF523 domain-containing protein [Peptostreptococcus faecalis]
MKESVIVSACLIGINCKYNGENNHDENTMKYLDKYNIIPVCPEQFGGLSTPRIPSEIEYGFEGKDILDSRAKVYDKNGKCVSKEFILGAEKTLKIALENDVKLAILKESSPSCGSKQIYNGKFENTKKMGMGVTSALLKKYDICVISESDI